MSDFHVGVDVGSGAVDGPLEERFDGERLSESLHWQTPPSRWELDSGARRLRVWTEAETDFWQRTHYGFRADNGHFLYRLASGDFRLQTRLRLEPAHQYDQAGLMVWISPSCWIKTSVEFEPQGPNQLGAVVTNAGYSDWSTQPLGREHRELAFRLQLTGQDVMVHSAVTGDDWQQLRVAPLLERRGSEPVRCGLYACSPKGAGFMVEFEYLTWEPI
jgi:uncharacterized protein